ncbi:MAG: MOSC domain-containing protein [Candidatus Eremiobacteraeota bacterium]|nr:MOSC domain-containing protein [Candidatus Eremiobacteraeota bacterium]
MATTFGRTQVDEPVRLRFDGIDGDEVGDPSVHGGDERALLCYARSNYEFWSERLNITYAQAFASGFGENLTVDGVSEHDICVGDRFELGTAIVEVAQPRSPCWKIGAYWNVSTLTKEVYRGGRSGWFLRVKQEGVFAVSDRLLLVDRPYPQFTIQALNDAIVELETHRNESELDFDFVKAVAQCPALSPGWRTAFAQALS